MLALASLPLAAGADTAGRAFVAGSQATGVFVRYGIPGFTTVESFVDSGGPVAQSVLDSTVTSASFASFPYPGSNAMAFPGLVAFATGTAPPGYPLHADAQHPTKPGQAVGDPNGPYSLSAAASSTSTTSGKGISSGSVRATATSAGQRRR